MDSAVAGIKAFGHRCKIIIKTDNELALTSLRDAVIQQLEHGAIPAGPPVHESESNGAIENGVKLFKGLLRVHLLALEKKIEGFIPSDHPVMSWLVECVSDVVTKYLQGNDGKPGTRGCLGNKSMRRVWSSARR